MPGWTNHANRLRAVLEDGYLIPRGKGVISDRHLTKEYQITNVKCGWCGGRLWQHKDSRHRLKHQEQSDWERHMLMRAILQGAKP